MDEEVEIDLPQNTTKSMQEQWVDFLRDINLDASQPDLFEKAATQVEYKGNWANLRKYKPYAEIHDSMLSEHAARMSDGAEWADTFVTQPAAQFQAPPGSTHANCEFSSNPDQADEDGCFINRGLENTSPTAAAAIAAAGCDDESYVPYTDDDNTNLWFFVPRAIPLWAKDEDSHIADWVEYFTLIRGMATDWWERNHGGIIRLSIGLYLNGVQLIPRGVRMTRRSPLARLKKWYMNPSLSGQKPGFYRTLKVLNDSVGKGAYRANSGNGLLDGSSENRDNCYILFFMQDIPYDLNSVHIRTPPEVSRKRTGDFIDKINAACHVNWAFVMPGARDSNSDAGKYIEMMKLVLQPGLQNFFPWDEDYSNIYRLESFQELNAGPFRRNLQQSMCMHAKRQQCKLSSPGKVITPTVAANYEESYYDTEAYDAYDNENVDYTAYEEENNEENGYDYFDEEDERSLDEEALPQPECCGGEIYLMKFNAAKKACVFDYDSNSRKIVPKESLY